MLTAEGRGRLVGPAGPNGRRVRDGGTIGGDDQMRFGSLSRVTPTSRASPRAARSGFRGGSGGVVPPKTSRALTQVGEPAARRSPFLAPARRIGQSRSEREDHLAVATRPAQSCGGHTPHAQLDAARVLGVQRDLDTRWSLSPTSARIGSALPRVGPGSASVRPPGQDGRGRVSVWSGARPCDLETGRGRGASFADPGARREGWPGPGSPAAPRSPRAARRVETVDGPLETVASRGPAWFRRADSNRRSFPRCLLERA